MQGYFEKCAFPGERGEDSDLDSDLTVYTPDSALSDDKEEKKKIPTFGSAYWQG